ncbi:hypothetical protein H8E88_03880 [candidate division KSB1 bacterium]|nr:hypothetical protein [candidate division KSB1 bacterium]MBL7093549.1 hypothetical protein [candidate division KSB1 bacterium]
MNTINKNSTSAELSSILEELLKADINFILVGGLAAVVQGAPVTTIDVDIVYDQSSDNIEKLYEFLKSIDAFYRRPDDKVILPKKDDFLQMAHRLLTTRLGPIDVLAFIEGEKTYEDLIEHSVELEFRGHTLHVLDLKMMIELKRTSKDPRDRQRLPVYEETLRQSSERLYNSGGFECLVEQ